MTLLNDRHDFILCAIMRYKYLDKEQIIKDVLPYCGGGGVTAPIYHKVMKVLVDGGLVRKIQFPKNGAKGLSVLFYITDKGAKHIARTYKDGDEMVQEYYQKVTTPLGSHYGYYHRKRMTDFRISLDKSTATHEQLEQKFLLTDAKKVHRGKGKEYQPETKIYSSDNSISITPDITVCLRSKRTNGEALFFAEIDAATEPIQRRRSPLMSSISGKYERYIQLFEDGNFTQYLDTTARAFRVLTVTETQSRIEGIREKLHHLTNDTEIFLLATHEDIQEHGILEGNIWQTLDPKSRKTSLNTILGIQK